jgi:transcriptional regulator of arginine metabolism
VNAVAGRTAAAPGAPTRTTTAPGPPARAGGATRAARRQAILDLVATQDVGSQEELAAILRARGFPVTQATVSRDVAELGLVKAPRGDHHAYVTPRTLAGGPAGANGAAGAGAGSGVAMSDAGVARLRRILADYPVSIARSGLSLVLVSRPGAASAIAQAIDESGLDDQVGTLAGDNTLLVLFADEPALERWRARFGVLAEQVVAGLPGTDLTSTYP